MCTVGWILTPYLIIYIDVMFDFIPLSEVDRELEMFLHVGLLNEELLSDLGQIHVSRSTNTRISARNKYLISKTKSHRWFASLKRLIYLQKRARLII
jgi:hypothetical protein